MPYCSATTSGEWFGNITPPAPSTIREVWAATWAINTAGADEATVAML